MKRIKCKVKQGEGADVRWYNALWIDTIADSEGKAIAIFIDENRCAGQTNISGILADTPTGLKINPEYKGDARPKKFTLNIPHINEDNREHKLGILDNLTKYYEDGLSNKLTYDHERDIETVMDNKSMDIEFRLNELKLSIEKHENKREELDKLFKKNGNEDDELKIRRLDRTIEKEGITKDQFEQIKTNSICTEFTLFNYEGK